MRATLEFDLPSDDAAYRASARAGHLIATMKEIKEIVREQINSGDPEFDRLRLAEIRDILYDTLLEFT